MWECHKDEEAYKWRGAFWGRGETGPCPKPCSIYPRRQASAIRFTIPHLLRLTVSYQFLGLPGVHDQQCGVLSVHREGSLVHICNQAGEYNLRVEWATADTVFPYCPFLSVTPSHFLGVGREFCLSWWLKVPVRCPCVPSYEHNTWYMAHGRQAQEAGSCQLNEHGLVGLTWESSPACSGF